MTGPHAHPGVLVVTGAYFPELSGAGLQCRELVRQLRSVIRFTVLTTVTDRTLPTVDECDGVALFRVFVDATSPWSKVRAAWQMTRAFLRERRGFEILHLHGFSQKSILLIFLGLLTGKRIAMTLHSVGHDDPVSIRARGRLSFWCYSRVHAFFGVSPGFVAPYRVSGLPPEKFRVIPNGIDLERFQPASPEERRALRVELNLPIDATLVLYVGFFSREKCADVLFEAWAGLAASGDRSTMLVFVGATRSAYYEVDAHLAEEIQHRALHLGLEGRVRFIGVTREVEKYQRASDIFVLPSIREGLPCALQEAMACGTACVATRLAGVTDALIDDGVSGILVPPRDVTAFEQALALLVARPDHARAMGERARERTVRDFAMAATAQLYLSAYRELLAS